MRPFEFGTRTGSVFLFMLLFRSASAERTRLRLPPAFSKVELAVSVSFFLHDCIMGKLI